MKHRSTGPSEVFDQEIVTSQVRFASSSTKYEYYDHDIIQEKFDESKMKKGEFFGYALLYTETSESNSNEIDEVCPVMNLEKASEYFLSEQKNNLSIFPVIFENASDLIAILSDVSPSPNSSCLGGNGTQTTICSLQGPSLTPPSQTVGVQWQGKENRLPLCVATPPLNPSLLNPFLDTPSSTSLPSSPLPLNSATPVNHFQQNSNNTQNSNNNNNYRSLLNFCSTPHACEPPTTFQSRLQHHPSTSSSFSTIIPPPVLPLQLSNSPLPPSSRTKSVSPPSRSARLTSTSTSTTRLPPLSSSSTLTSPLPSIL
eukprot:GDKJ01041619.1.p1 GENE.GDKJ01041619.1~~GDKJ01041619.1.p1  ORF type:complete len:359 (-),score=106.31 GDKJ01041619.1:324-1262(-)